MVEFKVQVSDDLKDLAAFKRFDDKGKGALGAAVRRLYGYG